MCFCYLVLQQSGRNPTRKTLAKYWTDETGKVEFTDSRVLSKPVQRLILSQGLQQMSIQNPKIGIKHLLIQVVIVIKVIVRSNA